jgi:hypothetical protein
VQHGFEHFPETFDVMVLLPNVPYLSTSQRLLAKVHQIIAPRCALLKKEENHRAKRWIIGGETARGNINAPCGRGHHHLFFPRRCLLFAVVDRTGVMAFACDDDVRKAKLVESLAEWLRNEPRVQGERNLGDIDSLTQKFGWELGEHRDEQRWLIGVGTPLFGAKEEMDRKGHLLAGEHNAEPILALHHMLATSTVPAPGTA